MILRTPENVDVQETMQMTRTEKLSSYHVPDSFRLLIWRHVRVIQSELPDVLVVQKGYFSVKEDCVFQIETATMKAWKRTVM